MAITARAPALGQPQASRRPSRDRHVDITSASQFGVTLAVFGVTLAARRDAHPSPRDARVTLP